MLANAALRASRSGVQAPVSGALSVLDRLAAGFGTAATSSAAPEPAASGAVDIAALRERLASGGPMCSLTAGLFGPVLHSGHMLHHSHVQRN